MRKKVVFMVKPTKRVKLRAPVIQTVVMRDRKNDFERNEKHRRPRDRDDDEPEVEPVD